MPGRVAAKSTSGELTRPKPALPDNPRSRATARIALAIGLIVLALWVAQDFLAPLSWAVVIALAVWPAYRKYAARIAGGPSNIWAPLSFTILVGLLLFVPVGLAIHQAALESQTLSQSVAHIRENGIAVPEWLPRCRWESTARAGGLPI